MTSRRRTFVPVVAGGVAAATLAAVASARPWVVASELPADPFDTVAGAGEMPLASALSLVLLACWGVVLFTRGVARRATAGLGLLAAAGVGVTVVVGRVTLPDAVAAAVTELGPGAAGTGTETTWWWWLAAVAALVSVVATAAAVAWAPSWPEMGSRYDAPGSDAATEPAPPGERSNLDLWKSLDEGRDPTA